MRSPLNGALVASTPLTFSHRLRLPPGAMAPVTLVEVVETTETNNIANVRIVIGAEDEREQREDRDHRRGSGRVGEAVAKGEIIADIETDKATFELAAPAAGTILEVFFADGDLVPVFTNVCVIGEPGESVEAFKPRAAPRPPWQLCIPPD